MEGREVIRVASACPGRIRLKFGPEKTEAPNLDDFLGIEGVKEVSFNPLTKSLVVLCDEEVPTEKVLEAIGGIPYLELQRGEPELNDPPVEDVLSSRIYGTAEELNEKVRKELKGHADLTSLSPSFLLLLGAVELFRKPVMPRWHDLWWYALNMYYWGYRDAKMSRTGRQ